MFRTDEYVNFYTDISCLGGVFAKIPILSLNFPRHSAREIFRNSTERCYIKRTTDNILQILLQASR
jgi:uncharacterized iron-regulated protein